MELSDAGWKKRLSKEQYSVLREKSTEPPFTGKLLKNTKDGNYLCAGCKTVLFDSNTKFDSQCGWPSFFDAYKDKIEVKEDYSYGMHRQEVLCKNCHGHLGHVFDDGPGPNGLRYCINSASLDFENRNEAKRRSTKPKKKEKI